MDTTNCEICESHTFFKICALCEIFICKNCCVSCDYCNSWICHYCEKDEGSKCISCKGIMKITNLKLE